MFVDNLHHSARLVDMQKNQATKNVTLSNHVVVFNLEIINAH